MINRTLFLSDIHLGTRGCSAELLLDFLKEHDADTIYLVGDIFDGWALRRGWHWPQSHNDVVQELLQRAHDGKRIVFVPGNHDEVMRNYLGTHFGGIEVMRTADFTALDGKRYLVTHGDQFDAVVMNAKWIAHLGDRAYEFLIWLNPKINRIRSLWSGRYWSLSKWAKQQVKSAVNFIGEYEDVLAEEARRGNYDGVICGHIHHANIKTINNILYVNTGDWVESCTAVIERPNGRLELIDWEAKIAANKERPRRRNRPKTKKNSLVDVQG
ncbi:UDP-2,3-diacylglucosamine hydrolase [Pelagimonas phthalicica]|uniref:UDP-2,3-diacylglucosamine hydrolase n=1 Tax=Pelagimonas phthalicica TaxID=1037362 RepID=A0A238JF26_9RHOB|nr:UDP-2,3-diacylglucosamine diphosphatase [Pelagimonas phthalicica]TDS92219.1 UDP-2,3-diacylglucosamine pyrophosphatase LpxH [Pelagimonas phthalicica]SMX29280.1 UDP-2,3-diacylglucosamine hydrolase [Pelagimonas phthalicica]